MEQHLEHLKNLFKKADREISDELKNVQPFVSQNDKEVASFLGIAYPETVFIIRAATEIYEWEQRRSSVVEEEPKQPTLLSEFMKPKLGESFSRKLALTISETGILDYGNSELEDIIKSFIETFEQENTFVTPVKSEGERTSSSEEGSLDKIKEKGKKIDKEPLNNELKNEQSVSIKQGADLRICQKEFLVTKESKVIKGKEALQEIPSNKIETNCKQTNILDEVYMEKSEHRGIRKFTLWDLPNRISNRHVTAIVKNIGKVREVQIKHGRNNKTRAELAIEMDGKKYEEIVKNLWSLPLINGSLARFTPGTSDNSILEERRTHHARLKNVPKNAKEVLLLRQVRCLGAKTVHIFNNRNGNRKGVAVVEFINRQEIEKAVSSKASYFNAKLQWELEPMYETTQRKVEITNKNLQKDASNRSKQEFSREMKVVTTKTRTKATETLKEDPCTKGKLTSATLEGKTHELEIDEIKKLLLNIASRLDNFERSQSSLPSRS